jgi:serine/threonine protein kinase
MFLFFLASGGICTQNHLPRLGKIFPIFLLVIGVLLYYLDPNCFHCIVPLQKPDNVGFDVRGDIKIFDFGLAREFPKGGKKFADDTYQMSGKTGSLRYMAPEVAKEKPYNETVDVYSLAMMAWQIFAMQVPFSGYSIAMHNEVVVEKGGRPKIETKWGTKVGSWMSKAWSPKISERPDMRASSKVFRDELSSLQDEIEDYSQIDASSRTARSAS